MDTVGDLLDEPRATALIEEYLPELKESPVFKKEKAFTLFKIVNRKSSVFDEELVRELNEKLKQISKSVS